MRKGFSLVELSIVLVILGLLVGGILAGQSLIRASELRAVGTEYNRWVTATVAFRDKYFALPGDMTNATAIWGSQSGATTTGYDATCGNNFTTANTSAGNTLTCNGDGNSVIAAGADGNPALYESWRFWQQLSNAGLIEGQYLGVSGTAYTGKDSVCPTNCPISKLNNGGWSVRSGYNSTWQFAGSQGNTFVFGANEPSTLYTVNNPIMAPEEAWNLDTKLDDGMPGTGKMLGKRDQLTCITTNNPATSVYKLDTSGVTCSLMFQVTL